MALEMPYLFYSSLLIRSITRIILNKMETALSKTYARKTTKSRYLLANKTRCFKHWNLLMLDVGSFSDSTS